MAKRPFQRRGGILYDEYVLPNGKPCVGTIPGHMLGEDLSPKDREAALGAMAVDPRATSYAVSNEHSPAHLDALLRALELGNIEVPSQLLAYVDDPRVRPALLKATRNAPDGRAANHLQALGLAGGPGAKQHLRKRIARLSALDATWTDDAFFNWVAGELGTAACALLQLDREADDAANALVRLFEHVCTANRRSAIGNATVALDHRIHTIAMERLRGAILSLSHADDETFQCALGTLLEIDATTAVARCERLLRSSDWATYMPAVNRLAEHVEVAGVRALLESWIPTAADVDAALCAAGALHASLARELLVDLLRRALADERPSLRWRAIECMSWVGADDRRALVAEARADEPDPALKRVLSEK